MESKTIELIKPINIDDQEVKVVTLDFEKVNGYSLLEIDRNLKSRGSNFSVYSLEAQIAVAAKAASMKPEDFEKFSGPDFLELAGQAAIFLLNMGSVNQEN